MKNKKHKNYLDEILFEIKVFDNRINSYFKKEYEKFKIKLRDLDDWYKTMKKKYS